MINIEKIDDTFFTKTIEFLKSVPSIESVDDKILKNACIAVEEEKIVGCISYEEFGAKGLIRYFVFKKVLDMSYLDSLINKLKENAIKNDIIEFVCVAESDQIKDLFRNLEFKEIVNDECITTMKSQENKEDKKFCSCYANELKEAMVKFHTENEKFDADLVNAKIRKKCGKLPKYLE